MSFLTNAKYNCVVQSCLSYTYSPTPRLTVDTQALPYLLPQVRVRVSLTGEDVRLVLSSRDPVGLAKRKLQEQEGVADPSRQRWYFGGKMLGKSAETLG